LHSYIEKYITSKLLNVSPEKSLILSYDTVVANERYDNFTFAFYKANFRHHVHKSVVLDITLSHLSVLHVFTSRLY